MKISRMETMHVCCLLPIQNELLTIGSSNEKPNQNTVKYIKHNSTSYGRKCFNPFFSC